jgi:hypothetical protein
MSTEARRLQLHAYVELTLGLAAALRVSSLEIDSFTRLAHSLVVGGNRTGETLDTVLCDGASPDPMSREPGVLIRPMCGGE